MLKKCYKYQYQRGDGNRLNDNSNRRDKLQKIITGKCTSFLQKFIDDWKICHIIKKYSNSTLYIAYYSAEVTLNCKNYAWS